METALAHLAASTPEEKIVGIIHANRVLGQIFDRYSSEKRPVAIELVLSEVYKRIDHSFVVKAGLSKSFPEVQKEAIEFISYHTVALEYLNGFAAHFAALVELLISTPDSELIVSLSMVLKHILHQTEYTHLVHGTQVLFNIFPVLSQSQAQIILDLLVDMLQSLSTSASKPNNSLLVVTQDRLSSFATFFIPCLHGAAPEGARDDCLRAIRDCLLLGDVLNRNWIFADISLPTTQSPRFCWFLLSIVVNELHISSEELLTGRLETNATVSQQGITRPDRAVHMFWLCLDLVGLCLDVVFSDEVSLSLDEISRLKQSVDRLEDDLLTLLVDGAQFLQGTDWSVVTDHSGLSMRAVLTRSLVFMRQLREEDGRLGPRMLSAMRNVFPPYPSFPPQRSTLFFSVEFPPPSNPPLLASMDITLQLLPLCEEITQSLPTDDSDGAIGLLDDLVALSERIVRTSSSLLVALSRHESSFSEEERDLVVQAAEAGTRTFGTLLQLKEADLALLFPVEGPAALQEIVGCSANALYELQRSIKNYKGRLGGDTRVVLRRIGRWCGQDPSE